MALFSYKGMNEAGKSVSGTRDAENERSAKQLLRKEGIFLTELRETKGGRQGRSKKKSEGEADQTESGVSFFQERISSRDLATATRQLATLIRAGIPLVDGVAALIDQLEKPSFKAIWSDVKQRVNEGSSFADALSLHPRAFSGLYVNMIRAGESSGAMDIVLERLADFTEGQSELQSKIAGTMVYPFIMVGMAFSVTSVLFIFVIPKISKIFASQGVALPLPTQLMIGASYIFRNGWYIALPLFILAIFGFRRYIQTEKGRVHWDRFRLDVPIFGSLIHMVAIARFCRTLETLLGSGVPLLVAFDIVRAVVQNVVLQKVIESARDCVREGESIAAPLKRSGRFPPIVTHMIAVGERSGQLEEMLSNVARSYDVQIEARLRAMTSLIEPLLIVFMGVIVAFIVMSILLPMLQISAFA